MRTIVEINNLTRKRINPEFVKKVVRKIVKLSGAKPDIFEISVVFVNEAEIRKINRKCRRKNKSTDVLSFCYDSGYNKSGNITGGNYISGEVILCPDMIAKNARESKVGFGRELAFVLAHGILHVLGWRHGRKMYKLQDEIVLRNTN
jgi:probable rRNA maturation factor